ncbi:MAG: hypothetical protein V3V57_07025 [Spirochaetia bacterium]
MKRRDLVVLLSILVMTITSCSPFGTSKKERVLRFEADLNGAREYVYQNFLEAETVEYATIRDSDTAYTWDFWFPLDFPEPGIYTITLDSVFGNPLEGTVDGPDVFSGPQPIEFYFARSGIYWYLEGLNLDGGVKEVD